MDKYGKLLPRHNDDENLTEVEITFPTFFEDKDPKGKTYDFYSTQRYQCRSSYWQSATNGKRSERSSSLGSGKTKRLHSVGSQKKKGYLQIIGSKVHIF